MIKAGSIITAATLFQPAPIKTFIVCDAVLFRHNLLILALFSVVCTDVAIRGVVFPGSAEAFV